MMSQDMVVVKLFQIDFLLIRETKHRLSRGLLETQVCVWPDLLL